MRAQGPSALNGGATAGAVEAQSAEHTSLALEHALAPVASGGGFVLDLGPASGSNVSFFAERGCKLFIADVNSSLFGSSNPPDRAEALDLALARDIPATESFDLVLLWDLLDYLDDAEIRSLGSHLRPVCHATTLLYAMISIRKEIPDRPSRFEIRNVGSILYSPGSQFQRPAALHREPELAKLMPDFEVESTYLLRHGMQEYLFRRRRTG